MPYKETKFDFLEKMGDQPTFTHRQAPILHYRLHNYLEQVAVGLAADAKKAATKIDFYREIALLMKILKSFIRASSMYPSSYSAASSGSARSRKL